MKISKYGCIVCKKAKLKSKSKKAKLKNKSKNAKAEIYPRVNIVIGRLGHQQSVGKQSKEKNGK
jgi:hypothetical protein